MNYKIIKNDIRNISLTDVGILGNTSIGAGFIANYLYFNVLHLFSFQTPIFAA